MNVKVMSRTEIETLIENGFPCNTAVISFYDVNVKRKTEYEPVDFKGRCERLFQVGIPDLDIQVLADFGYTADTYFEESGKLAEFISDARKDGFDIICQCEYGQSRSAGCAAAILEFYDKNGISIFSDYRYYPNQLVFNKVLSALKNNDREKLYRLCYKLLEEKYPRGIPEFAIERIEEELNFIGNRNYNVILNYHKLNCVASEVGCKIRFKGRHEGSFVAYLLGGKKINPLPQHFYCNSCGHYTRDVNSEHVCPICKSGWSAEGYSIPIESAFGIVDDFMIMPDYEFENNSVKCSDENIFGEYCLENVFDDLLDVGFDRQSAWKIAEWVRKGAHYTRKVEFEAFNISKPIFEKLMLYKKVPFRIDVIYKEN